MIPLYFRAQEKGLTTEDQLCGYPQCVFNALPELEIFIKVPKELRLPPNTVAKQIRRLYGTRDASKLLKNTYTIVLETMGFKTGVSNPCIFYHA